MHLPNPSFTSRLQHKVNCIREVQLVLIQSFPSKLVSLLLYLNYIVKDTHEIIGIYFLNKCTYKEIVYSKYPITVSFGNLLSFLLRCGSRPYEWGTQ